MVYRVALATNTADPECTPITVTGSDMGIVPIDGPTGRTIVTNDDKPIAVFPATWVVWLEAATEESDGE